MKKKKCLYIYFYKTKSIDIHILIIAHNQFYIVVNYFFIKLKILSIQYNIIV